MNSLFEKVAKYGFNKRFLTEDDFYKICEDENIEILWSDEIFSWYMTIDYEPFIVLPKRLRGIKLCFKMFHELGHHFWHSGEEANLVFFHGLTESKKECEADALAHVALVPKFALGSYEFLEDHPDKFARELFENRQKLEFLYGV